MTTHKLKIASEFFGSVAVGIKTAEIRFNDRNYKAGDYLYLCEVESEKFTGRSVLAEVTHVLHSVSFPSGLKDGYCMLSLEIARVKL